MRSMTWLSSSSVNKVKVNKGAVTCLICFQMEKCNWIRENTYWWSHQYTSSSIGQNNKVTTYVLQGFSLWLGSKSFKKKCVYVLVKECLCKKWIWTKWQSYFLWNAKSIFALSIHPFLKAQVMWGNLMSISIQLIFKVYVQASIHSSPWTFCRFFFCFSTLNHGGFIQHFSLLCWWQFCASRDFQNSKYKHISVIMSICRGWKSSVVLFLLVHFSLASWINPLRSIVEKTKLQKNQSPRGRVCFSGSLPLLNYIVTLTLLVYYFFQGWFPVLFLAFVSVWI